MEFPLVYVVFIGVFSAYMMLVVMCLVILIVFVVLGVDNCAYDCVLGVYVRLAKNFISRFRYVFFFFVV